MPGKTDQAGFLTALWGDQAGIAELACGRPRPEDRTKTGHFWGDPFQYPDGLDDYLSAAKKKNGKLNLYYGVCLRREKWPRIGANGKEEKRGTIQNVLSATCLWVDVDFKTVAREKALELLKKFPLKCSVGVFSGGGFQALWLLKEPVTGDALQRVPLLNVAISKQVGGDHTQDLARVFRLPETLNIKYEPAPLAEVVVWRPELRYTLMDFDFLPEEQPAPASADAGPVETTIPQGMESVDIDALPVDAATKKVIREGLPAYVEFRRTSDTPERFTQRKLSRSESDAWAVTRLLAAGVDTRTIFWIFRDPANKVGEKYLERKRDGDSYLACTISQMRKFLKDHPRTTPGASANQEVGKIERKFGDKGPFEVMKIIKYPQEPPTYEVIIRFVGQELTTKTSLKGLYHFEEFKKLHFAAHHRFLPNTKQWRWQQMIEDAETEEKQIEAEEATFEGRVASCVDELFESSVGEKSGEVAVQHMPVRTDDGRELVKTSVLIRYLRAQGVESDREKVIHAIKKLGWESTTQRFGQKVVRVWSRNPSKNGVGHVVQPELFPAPPGAGAPGVEGGKSGL